MNEDILAIGGFFFTVIVIVIGLPLVRAFTKRMERKSMLTPGERERDERLARMETAIESMAVEIERISEGQRFVTKLLAERERPAGVLPSRDR
jgi:hypothetical protein